MSTSGLSAADVCTRALIVAPRRMAVDDAARLMREHHVGALVVVDEDCPQRKVVGMLTDRDIVTSIVAKNVDPALVQVEDAMSADLVTVQGSDSVLDVLRSMRRKGVRRAPVVGEGGAPVGVVALDDVLGVVAQELRLMVEAIESGRRREPAKRP